MFPITNPVDTFSRGLQVIPSLQALMQSVQAARQQNELQKMLMPYAVPNAQAALTQAQVKAKYADPLEQAILGQQEAKAKYADPMEAAQLAKLNLDAQNPLLNQTGLAGQIGAALYLKSHGLDKAIPSPGSPMPTLPGGLSASTSPVNSLSDLIMNASQIKQLKDVAQTNLANKQASGYDFRLLPQNQKNLLQGYAMAMGYMPDEALRKFTQENKTLYDLAAEKGIRPQDISNLTPIYAPTTANLTQIQRRNQALAEINKLEPTLTDAMKPYARRIAGYSPQQIMDSIKGDDPDKQAQFWAAKALAPELASLRIKALGGQVGIEAMREVQDASMMNLKGLGVQFSPEILERTNHYITQWITDAANSANNVGLKTLSKENQGNIEASSAKKSPKMIRVKLSDGSTASMPEDKYDEAVKAKIVSGRL